MWLSDEHFATDTEMRSLESTLMPSILVLVQHFLTVVPFGMAMYTLCHFTLEVCDLVFDINFIVVTVKRLP